MVDSALHGTGFTSKWLWDSAHVQSPRTIVPLGGIEDAVLVLERQSPSKVILLYKENGAKRSVIVAEQAGLTHGLALDGIYLYASSDTTVYRWNFISTQRATATNMTVVIKNIDAGGHNTRTLVFDGSGRLYISVGSLANIDGNSARARILRFDFGVTTVVPAGGYDFQTQGEIFADGLRNTVALDFDSTGALWGIDNSATGLFRSDIGGEISEENPAEKLNYFPETNKRKFYGYPYCFVEYSLGPVYTQGKGSVWAWPSFMADGEHTDAWCRNTSNVQGPELAMPAHATAQGMTFLNSKLANTTTQPDDCTGAFPESMHNDLFIAFHGSTTRAEPTGFKVARIAMSSSSRVLDSSTNPMDLFWHSGTANWLNGITPVDVKFDRCNRLLVTTDGNPGKGIIQISYETSGITITTNNNIISSKSGVAGFEALGSLAATFIIGLLSVLLACVLSFLFFKWLRWLRGETRPIFAFAENPKIHFELLPPSKRSFDSKVARDDDEGYYSALEAGSPTMPTGSNTFSPGYTRFEGQSIEAVKVSGRGVHFENSNSPSPDGKDNRDSRFRNFRNFSPGSPTTSLAPGRGERESSIPEDVKVRPTRPAIPRRLRAQRDNGNDYEKHQGSSDDTGAAGAGGVPSRGRSAGPRHAVPPSKLSSEGEWRGVRRLKAGSGSGSKPSSPSSSSSPSGPLRTRTRPLSPGRLSTSTDFLPPASPSRVAPSRSKEETGGKRSPSRFARIRAMGSRTTASADNVAV
jgi:glucose/arabinose dehydrogenase